jgi:hypothetical protein
MFMNTSLFRSRAGLFAAALLVAVALPAHAGKGRKAAATQTFTIAAGASITVGDNQSATLANINTGDHVSIAYTEAGGVLTASKIKDLGANPVKQAKHAKSTAKSGRKAHAASGLRVQGIVTGVDVTGQTLTITEKKHNKTTGKTASTASATSA